VVISGDLASFGMADEYDLARDWLENQLWPALPAGFRRDRLLLVPGNHDVDRSKVGTGARAIQDGLLKSRSQEDIAALLGDDDERRVMLRRHTAYLDFCEDWFNEPQHLPWWQRIIEIRGTTLHVAGLDSAWMSYGDEDRDRLLLGRYQLTQTVVVPQAEEVDWRIALLHHPWSYLAEFDHDAARSAVHQHCDLLLRGHLHHPSSPRPTPSARPHPSL
jgi:predicted phosphodiesterase